MITLKFGGTSVESLDKISKVANFVFERLEHHKKIVVVVSAMGRTTNQLTEEIYTLSQNAPKREIDQLLSTGETKSAALLATALCELGARAISLTGWQAGVFTDKTFGGAFIEDIEESVFMRYFEKYDVLVVTGFQGVTLQGDVTTLGKGGSDTSAVAIASSLGCACEIYTDVEGVFTADPKVIPSAKKLDGISFADMMEASASGAKVMETRSIEIASKYNTKLYVGKSLEIKKEGTIVGVETTNFESMPIKNLVVQDKNCLLEINLKKGQTLSKVFEILSTAGQKVQGAMVQEKNYFSCIIEEKNKKNIEKSLKNAKINYSFKNYGTKMTLVGSGFQTHLLALRNIFSALEEKGIKLKSLSISETAVVVLIEEKHAKTAAEVLSQKLGL